MDPKYADQADSFIDKLTDFVSAHPKTCLVIVGVIVALVWLF